MDVGDFVTWKITAQEMQITGIMTRCSGKEYFCTMDIDGSPTEKVFHECEIAPKTKSTFGFGK